MPTQYTPTLKLALPITGELSGTWGTVVNDNVTSMIEQAIAGLSTINTWTTNSHTLTTANGTTSESRCAMLVAATGSGGTAITGAGEIICPAAAKLYVVQNATSFAVTLKTAAGTGVSVAAGNTLFLFCDGTNVNSCVTTIVSGNITGNLTVGGDATINGNTTLGNATSDTITATARFNTDLLPSTDNARDLGSAANSWRALFIDGTATMALVAISGGTINGVSIGATTAATFLAVDNLSLDGNTIASTNTNGNVVIAPNGTGDVQLDADTVRVGDAAAAATLTSNGAGALTVTTGGAANLTLSTNSGTNSGTVQIAQGVNGNITLTPNGTGSVSVPKLVVSTFTSTRVPYISTGGLIVDSANLTFSGTDLTVSGAVNAGSVNATTLDLTNLEVTNIKAKDGTTSITLADSTGVATINAAPVMTALTASQAVFTTAGKALVSNPITGTGNVVMSTSPTLVTPALGTPSSGIVTNLTGTASININGTVGATTANTGVFTTLSSTGDTTLGDASADTVTINGTVQPGVVISGSSTGDALRITQTGTGNALLVEDSTNPDSTPFVVDASGNVVIGSTSQITGSGYTPKVELLGTSNALTSIGQYAFSASGSSPINELALSRSATVGTHTVVQDGDTVGSLRFSGSDGTGFIRAAQIVSQVDGTPGTNDMPGRLIFATTSDGASAPTERMRITSAGVFGFNSTSTAGGASGQYRFAGDITGATNPSGVVYTPLIKSDATLAATIFNSQPSTEDVAFTLGALNHFSVTQGTITGGSRTAPTTQIGFSVPSGITGATNNYGFSGAIPSGTGRYNLYMSGSADNFLAGSLGIGGVPIAGSNLHITKNLSGAANSYGMRVLATAQSDATTSVNGVGSTLSTAAGAYTVATLSHYGAFQGTFGAGNIVSQQHGFLAGATLAGSTLNSAFAGFLTRPTQGTFTGSTALNVSQSGTTVTVTTTANHNLVTGQVVTIALTANATALVSGVPCTILTVGTTDFTLIGAASNTVGVSFVATGAGTGTGTVTLNSQGSGEAITNTGLTTFTYVSTSATFAAVTVLTGAITIAQNYNLYCSGTADNYINGVLGIGALSSVMSAASSLYASKAITGTGLYGIFQAGTVQSDVTGNVQGFRNSCVQVAGGALNSYYHFSAIQGTVSGTITNQWGFVSGASLIGATANIGFYASDTSAVTAGKTAYGFYSAVEAATGGGLAYGFVAVGTAPNVFHNLGITSTLGYTAGGGGVVTQGVSRTTAVTLNKAAGQITMFTAAGSATWASFQVNNSLVTANDTVVLSVNGATNSYVMTVSSISAGAFTILFSSVIGTASDTPKINFTVIKGAIS